MSSAQVKITQLPAAGPITGTESVPIVQNGLTVQTTTGAIAASPSQTQTFVTVNQESTLPNSRYLSTGVGLGLTDGGAQSFYRLTLNAASGSLEAALTGIVAKTDAATVVSRTITSGTSGLTIANGDGVAGNPTLSLSGTVLSLASLASTGMLSIGGGSVNARVLYGTADQISVLNGNGIADPVFGLANNPVIPGSGGIRVPQGTTAQRPAGANGWIRYNTDINGYEAYEDGFWNSLPTGAVTLINTGAGLTGGPITSTGTISIDSTVVTLTGSQVLTNKTISGSNNSLSNIANASLTNSSVTYNGVAVVLGASGTITANTTNALTVGTGLQLDSGTTFNGSAARTISLTTPVTAALGGTGSTSYAVGDILYASGATALSKLAIGTQGFVLTAGATGPVWSGISGGTF